MGPENKNRGGSRLDFMHIRRMIECCRLVDLHRRSMVKRAARACLDRTLSLLPSFFSRNDAAFLRQCRTLRGALSKSFACRGVALLGYFSQVGTSAGTAI